MWHHRLGVQASSLASMMFQALLTFVTKPAQFWSHLCFLIWVFGGEIIGGIFTKYNDKCSSL